MSFLTFRKSLKDMKGKKSESVNRGRADTTRAKRRIKYQLWPTIHYTETLRLSNRNPTKTRGQLLYTTTKSDIKSLGLWVFISPMVNLSATSIL